MCDKARSLPSTIHPKTQVMTGWNACRVPLVVLQLLRCNAGSCSLFSSVPRSAGTHKCASCDKRCHMLQVAMTFQFDLGTG